MLKRLILGVLGACSVMGAEAFACSVAPPTEYPTDSKEIVEVKIGDTYFRFPESFFYFPEDRLPIERDYIRIRVSMPDFKALPIPSPSEKTNSADRMQGNKQHSSLKINIRENGKDIFGYSNNTPSYPITKSIELQYYGSEPLTPEGVREKLKPFMYSKPSAHWSKNQQLAKALLLEKEHHFSNPCAAFDRPADKPLPLPPPPPPLVPMKIIEQGLAHKNPAIRATALQQLARHVDSPEIAKRLYEIARNDKEYTVRSTAIFALKGYKSSVDVIPLLVTRLQQEPNDQVIQQLGRLFSPKDNIAPALLASIGKAKGERLYQEAHLLAWSINFEAQSKNLTQYAQLSAQSKHALNAVMDFYERPDVPQGQKEQIRNTLINSKTAIATPRYINLMMQQKAIAELGSLASEPEKVIPFLIDELKSNRVGDYSFVAESLGKFGPNAKTALPYLLPLLHFTCPGMENSQNGLIMPPIPSAQGGFDPTKCIDYMAKRTRQMAASTISQIGIASPEVLNALYAALNDKDVIYSAGEALAKLEPDQDKLLKKFIELLATTDNYSGQGWIIRILEEMGPKAQPALPALKKLMASSQSMPRDEIRRAIEKISGEKLPPDTATQHPPIILPPATTPSPILQPAPPIPALPVTPPIRVITPPQTNNLPPPITVITPPQFVSPRP